MPRSVGSGTRRDARPAVVSSSTSGVSPSPLEPILADVVRRILSVGSPQAIVLFGSQARGDARPDSDLDLLIVEESDLPRYRRSPRYLRALVGIPFGKDVVVWTPDEIRAWQGVPGAFVTTALREGRVLYAR